MREHLLYDVESEVSDEVIRYLRAYVELNLQLRVSRGCSQREVNNLRMRLHQYARDDLYKEVMHAGDA